jgi:hypothetical protein
MSPSQKRWDAGRRRFWRRAMLTDYIRAALARSEDK